MIEKNLVDPMDLTKEELDSLMELAEKIIKSPREYADICKGKIMANLFFEPSTRTRLSFESAMLRLGGQVIGFSDLSSSSVIKGESFSDTIRTVSLYSDLLVIRHFKEGAPKYATEHSDVPIINAGDGSHQHPTQTLADIFIIKKAHGEIKDLTIGFCGDLKFGRTVHSLTKTLLKYPNIKFIFISPPELRMPKYIKRLLNEKNAEYIEVESLQELIDKLDILYMTRVQKERFFNEADYVRLKDSYILTTEHLKVAKENLAILHPLPRVNEIDVEVDKDPRAMYFRQARFGMYMRMALIMQILEASDVKY